MSIGKNAIKRVENNGYSKVKTTAPDMINSTVIGATDAQVMNMVEKQTATANKPTSTKSTAKKTTAKTTTAKKVEQSVKAPAVEEKAVSAKTVKKATKKVEKTLKTYAFGDELPIYLL